MCLFSEHILSTRDEEFPIRVESAVTGHGRLFPNELVIDIGARDIELRENNLITIR